MKKNTNYVNAVIRNTVKRIATNNKVVDSLLASDIELTYNRVTTSNMTDKQVAFIESLGTNQAYAILSSLNELEAK